MEEHLKKVGTAEEVREEGLTVEYAEGVTEIGNMYWERANLTHVKLPEKPEEDRGREPFFCCRSLKRK